MRKRCTMLFVLSIYLLFYCNASLGYSLSVHKQITEETIQQNLIKINTLIRDYTGLDGVDIKIDDKTIREWIKEGSWKEDLNWQYLFDPLFSHFYNPLTNKSGVGDSWLSAYEWANASSNNWSWRMARDYLYKGLTLTTKTEREKALADAFRAVGHVIHLVQDVGTPAHVRGDLHISEPYEKYTNKKIGDLNYTPFPFGGTKSSVSSGAPKQLWDSDTYDGGNPSSTANIGLAEYTNANFLSDNTIFKNFPYPKYSSESYDIYDVEHSATKKRIYLRKKGDGEFIEHFATAGPLYKHLSFDPVLQRDELKLDSKCHEDYAALLIPRAVGYSAGLLNYFFRGDIDLIPDEAQGSGYVIENKTDEDMNGTFELWYDNKNDERVTLTSFSLRIGKKSSGNNKSVNITFSPQFDAKKFCKYILVFKGQLGQEQNAVIGKVINPKECFLGAAAKLGPGVTIFLTGIAPIYKDIYPLLNSHGKNQIMIRFAEGNPFIFGILSDTRKVWGQDFHYTVDLFEVDKKTLLINYIGEVLKISNPYIRYPHGSYPLYAQDLFISNDGKTVKIMGAYSEFIKYESIGNCSYKKIDRGYFINESKHSLGWAGSGPLAIGGISVYALTPEEIYLEYLYSKPIGCSGSWWSPTWEYEYGYEVKVGANVIYSASGTFTSGDNNPPPFEGYYFYPSVNFILKRDRGYSLSLTKYSDTPGVIDVASYSSEEGFFCEKKDIKWQQSWSSTPSELLTSSGAHASIRKLYYYSTLGISFSPNFKECGGGANSGFSIKWSDFNNTDITIWRNWREEE